MKNKRKNNSIKIKCLKKNSLSVWKKNNFFYYQNNNTRNNQNKILYFIIIHFILKASRKIELESHKEYIDLKNEHD